MSLMPRSVTFQNKACSPMMGNMWRKVSLPWGNSSLVTLAPMSPHKVAANGVATTVAM